MNPLSAAILLAFVLAATVAPWRRPGWKPAGIALAFEFGTLAAAVFAALLLGELVVPRTGGAVLWGKLGLYAAAYWYALAGGMAVVRLVLGLVPARRAGQAGATEALGISDVELSRGRIIGVLERAIALTLVLLDQYGALGLVVAAKALARMRLLENREFAEYFLIGTLTSLAHALLVGVGLRLLL